MPSAFSFLGRAALAAALLSASQRVLAQCQLDTNVGTNLGLTDDSLSAQQALGFSFPFAGANYDSVYVSSNGFVYLFDSTGSVPPPTSSLCCNGSATTMLGAASPMVCALWMDLNPTVGGSVNFNQVSATKALITWLGVPEYNQTATTVDLQIALNASGQIDIYTTGSTTNVTHTGLTGWSPGNGATDPGPVDLSSLPVPANSATAYELFTATNFDIAGIQISGVPTGPTSWLIVPGQGCALAGQYGQGCPKPCDTLEEFAASTVDLSPNALQFTLQADGSYVISQCTSGCFDTSFTNNLALTDDSLAVGLSLGFTFPFCGGSTSTIDVCSNGFVWLVSGSSTLVDFSPTQDEFRDNPARVAPLWMDLRPGPTYPGGVYFDALPGKAIITWDQLEAYGVTGSSNTMQLQLFPNGDMIFAYQSVLNNATTGNGAAIAGFTQGAVSAANVVDWTASLPYRTGSGTPLDMRAQAGSRPVLGTTFNLDISKIRAGSVGGALSIGVTNPNLDLSFLGLAGCRLLSSLEVSLPIALSIPVTTVPLPIPNRASLIGRSLNTQAVLIDPSLGSLPVYLSNGVVLTFGM
ncbi:MAG: hypothetical protein R3F56_03765 [Planctomycetota bacterium]